MEQSISMKLPHTTDNNVFFAQLKELGKETEDNLDDGLCRACARLNWRQLIGSFFDKEISSSIQQWKDAFGFHDEESEQVLATIEAFRTYKAERDTIDFGNKWPSSAKSWFPLAPACWVTANRDICSLCSLITRAAAANNRENGSMVPDPEDTIAFWFARDSQYPSSMFHVSTIRSLLQEVGDRWQLSFCFYDDGKSQIRTIRQGSNKILTHPINWFMDCISPREIDFKILKFWISNCKEKHQACRHDEVLALRRRLVDLLYRTGGHLPYTLRLIDVLKDEVVESREGESYLALSYVWGTATQYKAVSKNFRNSILSLDRSILPRTIQDAMHLVQELGERYLWVDVLCIMQDDPNELSTTLHFMNKVYSNAFLTIVAADGSADHGLKGVLPNSRDIQSVTGSVDTIPFMQEVQILDMNNTAWAQRGWTFQEGIFAKKWLIFSNSRVFFACLERVVGEEQPDEPIGVDSASRQDYKTDYYPGDSSFWNDYKQKVTLYTSRHLTYESDVEDAFSGLMERYRELSGNLFSSCLPTNTDSLFSLALLWRSGKNGRITADRMIQKDIHPLIRRTSPIWKQGREVVFPSWSWIGWKGSVVWTSPGGVFNDLQSLTSAIAWPWILPNMADWRRRAIEEGVLNFETETAMLSPTDLQSTDAVYLDDGTVWTEGRRKCVAIASQTPTSMVFLLIVTLGTCGIYSREGVCAMNATLWSKLATRERLFLG